MIGRNYHRREGKFFGMHRQTATVVIDRERSPPAYCRSPLPLRRLFDQFRSSPHFDLKAAIRQEEGFGHDGDGIGPISALCFPIS